ncbi:Histone deacetylase hda1 [Kappamyces sp. JEL0680]|nr:Histone deacetylase hda1 [Kappamyces sp. JEL0680]
MLKSLARGKLVLVFEGGYNTAVVSECVLACVQSLVGQPLPPLSRYADRPAPLVLQVLDSVKRLLGPFWQCMMPPLIPSAGNAIRVKDMVTSFLSQKWQQAFRLSCPISDANLLVHTSPDYCTNTSTCFVIVQRLYTQPLPVKSLSCMDFRDLGIEDASTVFIESTLAHGALLHISTTEPLELVAELPIIEGTLAKCTATTLVVYLLDVPTATLEPLMDLCTRLGQRVATALLVTGESEPTILRKGSPQLRRWMINNCTLFEPSFDRFNRPIVFSDNPGETDDYPDPPRLSIGTADALSPSTLLLFPSILLDLALKASRDTRKRGTAVPLISQSIMPKKRTRTSSTEHLSHRQGVDIRPLLPDRLSLYARHPAPQPKARSPSSGTRSPPIQQSTQPLPPAGAFRKPPSLAQSDELIRESPRLPSDPASVDESSIAASDE